MFWGWLEDKEFEHLAHNKALKAGTPARWTKHR
jgi:hypothetical protein